MDKNQEDKMLFRRVFLTVNIFFFAYSLLFFALNARFMGAALAFLSIGGTLLNWLLVSKNRLIAAKSVLIVSSLLAIYSTSLGIPFPVYSQFYYLPAAMLPFLLLGRTGSLYPLLFTALVPLFWSAELIGPLVTLPSEWIPATFPEAIFRVMNGAGALFLTVLFLWFYRTRWLALLRQLNNQNLLLATLVESLDDIVFELDEAGVFLSVWVADESRLFLPKEKFLGKPAREILPPELSAQLDEKMQLARNSQQAETIEYSASDETGAATRWFRGRLRCQRKTQDVRFTLLISDVTQDRLDSIKNEMLRRQLEEAQRVAKIGSWSFDVKTQKISWSDQMYMLFDEDRTRGEPGFERHRETIHPEDRESWHNVLSECLTEGRHKTIRFRSIFPDKTLWIEAICHPSFGVDGEVISLHGTCQDVTEQVRVDEENRFIIQALNIGIWKFNPVNQSLHWDKSMYALFDLEESKFSGHYHAWESSLTPESKGKAVEELQLALEGKKEFDTTFSIKTKDGSVRHIGGRGKVVRDNVGKPVLMYGMNWDRTREVELQQSLNSERSRSLHQAKLASLGEMSAGIAHEINNPLAIIVGASEIMERQPALSPQVVRRIDMIKNATARISKIVSGLRKFSRTTEVKNYKDHSWREILGEVQVLAEVRARKADARLEIDIGTDARIWCDEVEIEQVVINLLNNAFDAVSELPERWVKVSAFEEGDQVVLRVTDSGSGIPPEVEVKLFQPFFTTKPVGQGTGLGLPISKGILDEHHATITTRRDLGPNTCFEIRFSAHRAADAA